jgi:type I restriction enzyme S subunit
MKNIQLKDLLKEPTRNGLTKPKAIRGNGVKMISMGEIFSHGRIADIEMDRVPVSDKELSNCQIEKGDLLFARQSLVLDGAGKCSIVTKANEPTVFESHLIRARIDEKKANPYFLYYYFNSRLGKDNMRTIVEQVAAAGIRGSDLINLWVPSPSIEVQNRIADILIAIDKKIELNYQINDNLEQQAQSYFQELFVDNASPEWTTGTISDLGTVVGGSTPSKSKPEYYTESGIAWITPKDLSINKSKFVSHGENDITELGLKNSSAAIMPEGTVLFSSRAPIGYIAIAAGEVTTNQGFKSVVPKPEIGTPFVYFFLKNTLPVIEGMASGSTFKEVSGSTMKNVPAVIPDAETLAKFSDFCAPIFEQQRTLEEQNQSLAKLRDSLLPKLMSGEIDVSAVQL